MRRSRISAGRPRVHALNQNAFDEVTEASAYWVGMMMTDGCLHDQQYSMRLVFSLKQSDGGHVSSLREFLGSSHPLRIYPPHSPNREGATRIQIACGQRIADALIGFGVTPRKTHTAKVIGLESNHDFWRGCIDGDGTVRLDRGRPVLSLCGASLELLHQFSMFVRLHCPTWKGHGPGKKCHGVFYVCLTGQNAIRMIRTLYGTCSIALPRKWTIAKAIIAKANENPRWCVQEGTPLTTEHRAAISAGSIGMKKSSESIAKRLETLRQNPHKIYRGGSPGKRSPESRMRMRLAKLGKKLSPEHRAAIAVGNTGKKMSPECIAKRIETRQRTLAIMWGTR